MTFTEIQAYCKSKPGAYEVYPFGPLPVCYKVVNRIFFEGYPDEKITVREEPMLADYYRKTYPDIIVPGYHCPDRQKRYKSTVYLNKGLSDDIIYDLIDHSYNEAVLRLKKQERLMLQNNLF